MVDITPWIQANLSLARGWIEASSSVDVDRNELLAAETSIWRAADELGDAIPMRWLRSRVQLSPTELRVVWLAIAHELCPNARTMLRALSTETLSDPTTDVLRRVAYAPNEARLAWSELALTARLRRLQLLERTDGSDQVPEHRQTWRVSSRLLALVHGDRNVDHELVEMVSPTSDPKGIAGAGLVLEPATTGRIESAVRGVLAARRGLVIVHGSSGTGRRSVLVSLASDALVIESKALAKEPASLRRQLRALVRESILLSRPLLFRGLEDIADLDVFERETEDVIVLATAARSISRRWRRAPRTVEIARISGVQRTDLWERALAGISRDDAERLATMYPIAPALIAASASVALEQASGSKLSHPHIVDGMRTVLDDRLSGLATRLIVKQSWDDLVLHDDQLATVIELIARVRERRQVYENWNFETKVGRALGVAAMFSGPPGTGKTMAAGLIARELGLEVYQVDTSRITSKWIGETEKNLGELFDAAEAGQAILLFDEADALFGKRTDVKSSNDRNANQETNFLLQRMESFSGVCILTSNHEDSLDEAFHRRLSLHVRFTVPDPGERARLWKALLPAEAPIEADIDFRHLATSYEMSGGYIRNAVLRAAFCAANRGSAIAEIDLTHAAQREYEAMGRLTTQF